MILNHSKPMYQADDRRAFVAFKTSDQKWLQFLCGRDFQHCSVHICDADGWTSIEGLAGYTEIFRHEVSAKYDLPETLRQQGMLVIEAPMLRNEKAHRMQWPAFYTCVELAKRILGIHKFFILTPPQLYRHIIKMNGENNA